MNVADDIERTMLLLQVVPQWLAFNNSRIHFFDRFEHMNVAKSFALQSAQ